MRLTDDFYDNLNPCFDANGEYLYYLSSRNFDIQMDFYEDNHVVSAPQNVMVVQLKANQHPPFIDTLTLPKPKESPFRIDLQGLRDRTYPIPNLAGNYFFLKAGKGRVLWSSVDRFTEAEYEEIFKPGASTKWQLHMYDIADRKETVLNDKIRDFQLSTNGEQMILQSGADYYTTSVDKAYQSKTLGTKLATEICGITPIIGRNGCRYTTTHGAGIVISSMMPRWSARTGSYWATDTARIFTTSIPAVS